MNPINVGVFLPNWIGDVVMATPALRALREHFGNQVNLIGVLRPYVSEVLAGTPWLDEAIYFDRHAPHPQMWTRNVISRIRARQLDSIVYLTNSLRAAAIGFLARVPQRIGYVRYGRRPLLTEKLYPPRNGWQLEPISAVDYYLNLARAMGANWTSRKLQLATLPEDERQADETWHRLGLEDAERVVMLNTGGAYGSAKQWPLEYFASLSRRLIEDEGTHVLVLCGPAERDSARRIEDLTRSRRVQSVASELLSIGFSKALVRRGDLLITTDSGPRHFGAAFGVPTLTLFGPTDPRWSENYHPNAVHLRKDMECSPCAKRSCPLGHHRCMRELTADQVYYEADRILRESPRRQVA